MKGPNRCRNPLCQKPLVGMRPHARACSDACKMRAKRIARRRQRTLEHPRCVVCWGPMVWPDDGKWQGRQRTLSAVTCSRKCALTRANWFRDRAAA